MNIQISFHGANNIAPKLMWIELFIVREKTELYIEMKFRTAKNKVFQKFLMIIQRYIQKF